METPPLSYCRSPVCRRRPDIPLAKYPAGGGALRSCKLAAKDRKCCFCNNVVVEERQCWRSIHGVNHAHAVDTCGRACFCTWTGCPDCFLCSHDERRHDPHRAFEVSQ